MFKKLTPQQLNRRLVEIMTGITLLTLIVFAVFFTCHFTKVPWNVIVYDIGIGLFVCGLSVWVWGCDYDETYLLPVGFIISLLMYSGIGFFSFIATIKALDIVVNILSVLWIIVGSKCFYYRNSK
jgi:hypothetical protein